MFYEVAVEQFFETDFWIEKVRIIDSCNAHRSLLMTSELYTKLSKHFWSCFNSYIIFINFLSYLFIQHIIYKICIFVLDFIYFHSYIFSVLNVFSSNKNSWYSSVYI